MTTPHWLYHQASRSTAGVAETLFTHNPCEEKDICALLRIWHSSCVIINADIAGIRAPYPLGEGIGETRIECGQL